MSDATRPLLILGLMTVVAAASKGVWAFAALALGGLLLYVASPASTRGRLGAISFALLAVGAVGVAAHLA